MADEKELTQADMVKAYDDFGVKVAEVLATVSGLGYDLNSDITMSNLAKWEDAYFSDSPKKGKFNEWLRYIKAAVSAGFFLNGTAPKAKDVDNMKPSTAQQLFKAVDYVMLRAGQVDPNF